MARGENVFYRKDGRFEARYVKGYQGKHEVCCAGNVGLCCG